MTVWYIHALNSNRCTVECAEKHHKKYTENIATDEKQKLTLHYQATGSLSGTLRIFCNALVISGIF